MRIITDATHFASEGRSAVAIGKFDGVHRGHRKLLSDLMRSRNDLVKTVFTFEPSFASYFAGYPVPELSTKEEKRRLFEEMGIDLLIEFPVNDKTVSILPKDFITDILVKRLRAADIYAGSDLSFGFKGEGGLALMELLAVSGDFQVHLVPKLRFEGREISSTYVREAVKEGRMELASDLLGRPYSVRGMVQHGAHLGHDLGFPTLNLQPTPSKLLPPRGVYFSEVIWQGQLFYGMTNVGTNPTVNEGAQYSIETHVFDFDREIYGDPIEVRFLTFRREEQQFSSLQELTGALERDASAARAFFQERGDRRF